MGTFHAFCNALLLERNPKLQTLDDVDHWILLRRNLSVLALERYRRLAEPGQFLGDFVKFFSRCQDELVTPDDYERYVESLATNYAREKHGLAEDERGVREERIAEQREIARAYRASDRLLRERNLLTFGMQLLDAVHLLRSDPTFAAALRARYRYILVDEFQDTNIAQIELLWQLAADHRNVVAVGDNAQAIYRFRGASFGSFTIFLERFARVPRSDLRGRRAICAAARGQLPVHRRAFCARPAKWSLSSTIRRSCPRRSWCRTNPRAKKCASWNSGPRRMKRDGLRRKSNACTRPA